MGLFKSLRGFAAYARCFTALVLAVRCDSRHDVNQYEALRKRRQKGERHV